MRLTEKRAENADARDSQPHHPQDQP
jgi:hypothetical protein